MRYDLTYVEGIHIKKSPDGLYLCCNNSCYIAKFKSVDKKKYPKVAQIRIKVGTDIFITRIDIPIIEIEAMTGPAVPDIFSFIDFITQ